MRGALQRRLFQQLMRYVAAKRRAQQDHDAFGENASASCFEIGAHALGVDGEALGCFRHRGNGDAQGLDDGRDDGPLRLPAAHAALVFLHHGGKERSQQSGNAVRGGQRERAGDGVVLVRHGGRAAASVAAWFRGFGDLALH